MDTERTSTMVFYEKWDLFQILNPSLYFLEVQQFLELGHPQITETISSQLHKHDKSAWVNLGIRGAVSFQEYIALVQNITTFRKIKTIFLISGINDLYRNLCDSYPSLYDKRFSSEGDIFNSFSARRISAYIRSLISWHSVEDILIATDRNSTKKSFDRKKSFELFKSQYKRNFFLYSALKRQCDCRLVFGFQPFYHYAKSVGTCREIKAINRTEYLQANTEWNKVKKEF